MLRARIAPAIAGVLAAMAVGGCSAGSTSTAADTPEVAWASTVCGAVAKAADKVPQYPKVDLRDPEKTKKGYVEHLRTLSGALGDVRADIKKAGAPPVQDGTAVLAKTLKKLTTGIKAIDSAAAKLAKTDAKDQPALRAALAQMTSAAKKTGSSGDLIKFLGGGNEDLRTALAAAPACAQFVGSGSR